MVVPSLNIFVHVVGTRPQSIHLSDWFVTGLSDPALTCQLVHCKENINLVFPC